MIMLRNDLIIKKDDLANLGGNERIWIEQMIKKEFAIFDEIKEFALDKLIEYRAKCFVLTDSANNDDSFVSKKQDMRLMFDAHELNLKYEYVDY
ncbi:hypothetical protein NHP164001_12490 [Helicobacter trogontum]|uniref:Uncharacterized protein n=2 Tax=Helicobacter trogontum TaxID=50960 RepID=A0ABQ0D4G1_9HELI